MRSRFEFAAAEFWSRLNGSRCHHQAQIPNQQRETRTQSVRVVSAADGWQRRSRAGFSWRLPSARVGSENGVGGDGREEATKKAKKSTTTMRFELTRFWRDLIPVAEKMDFYVSHFLTGIISREKLAAEGGRQCPKNVKVRLTTRE